MENDKAPGVFMTIVYFFGIIFSPVIDAILDEKERRNS